MIKQKEDLWRGDYKYFSVSEMACKCGCGGLPRHSFMLLMEELRQQAGFPMSVSSGFRCPEYNAALGGGPTHPLGLASDIRISGSQAAILVGLAYQIGFMGVGVKQHGPRKGRFIHLDSWDSDQRPMIWSYQ